VQWGIVYAAGAWGFLQGLEYVTDTFQRPGPIQQLATLALLIGLPVVLVTAWYHGDQGRQRVSAAELSVAARTSSFQFKGEKRDVAEIAAQLKVRMVLGGSVRKQAERVRVTAQLIDAQSGFHLWSETFERELKVRELDQDEGEAAVSGTSNVEAHDLYLRGLTLWQTREENALFAAIDAFERAVAVAPGFAQAWGGLAMTYAVLPAYTNRLATDVSADRSLDAAQRALALDPAQPEPYLAMGNVAAAISRRRETGTALLRRALELRPSSTTVPRRNVAGAIDREARRDAADRIPTCTFPQRT
jgi:hypothetical protein